MKSGQSYHTIEDFLISHPLTIDVEIEDEWSGCFPVKGVELEAAVLHVELDGYYRLLAELRPSEMLIYVNNFLAWTGAAAERSACCVLHRYLDHAVVMLFARKFGSADPFADALGTARWLGEHDVLRFRPHMGIAVGKVTAGFTGIPKKYSASVFGTPVMQAAAFAGARPGREYIMRITVASEAWGELSLEEMFPPVEYDDPRQGRRKEPQTWELRGSRTVETPVTGRIAVRDIVSFIHWMPDNTAEKKAREWFAEIRKQGYYRAPS